MTAEEDRSLGPLPSFLLGEASGITPVIAPTGVRAWLVRDYDLSRAVLTDRRFSRAEAIKPGAPKFMDADPAPESMMSMDGSAHARLRRFVAGAFSTAAIAALTPVVETLADYYLDEITAGGPPADLISEFARPLALAVLSRLLGIPPEDSGQFREWVEVLFDISSRTNSDKSLHRVQLAVYMMDLMTRKRAGHENDLLTSLTRLYDAGDLTHPELITLGLTLLMAGYETTAGQIGITVLSLLSGQDDRRGLPGDPGALASAVEESLRLSPATPVSFSRVTTEPVTIGGVALGAGESVVVSLLHANRDPRVFGGPPAVRPARHPPAHITFGHGVHRCLGAPLARLQLQVALGKLQQRFPELHLAPGDGAVSWKDGMAIRGLTRLLVGW